MGLSKWETLTQNFKHNIKLTGIRRVYFCSSEWENLEAIDKVSVPYILYRFLFLTYFIVCLAHSIYRDKTRQYWIIMATHWSFLIQTAYAGLYFGNLVLRYFEYRREAQTLRRQNDTLKYPNASLPTRKRLPTELNVVDSIVWLLLSVAGTVPYIVTLGYWIFVYNPSDPADSRASLVWNLTVHGFNAVLALIDILVIAIPVRVAHALYTMIFALAYVLFSCIYEYAGGSYKDEAERPYIYSLLNWRENPEWAIISCVGAVVAAFGLHILLWFLYKFRLFLVSRLQSRLSCYSSRA